MSGPVVYVSYLPGAEKGGQVNLLRLVRGIDAERYPPTVLVPAEGTLAAAAREAGALVATLRLRAMIAHRFWTWPAAAARTVRLRHAVRQAGARIVYVDGPEHVRAAWLATRGHKASVVWHVQTAFRSRFDAANLRMADAVVSVSASVDERFFGLQRPAVYRRIPNACDVARFRDARPGTVRQELDTPEDAPVLLFVGELGDHKGIRDLLRAFPPILRRHPGAHLWVAGQGPAEYCEELRREHADARIRWLGHRPDIERLLSAATLFVFPSHAEGSPLAAIEAMAAGVTIVASDITAHRELLLPDRGVLARPRDPVALADAVGALLSDPGRGRGLAESAARAASSKYDLPSYVAAFQELFDELSGSEEMSCKATLGRCNYRK